MQTRFVLASGSPRRRDLLSAAGYVFDVVLPQVAELETRALSIGETTLANARRKAIAVAREHPDAVVLGADTLVALDGAIIGKPADRAHAFATLRRLSGRTHVVCTAVVLARWSDRRRILFTEFSEVEFRDLSDSAIRDYIRKVDPLDKAGGYAAQGRGAEVIARITGSYTNVVGLPMERTQEALRAFGVAPALRSPKRQSIV